MARPEPTEPFPEGWRREVFEALVEAQDRGLSVPESRKQVAQHYDVSEEDVCAIESEGVAKDWPPL